MIDNPMFTKIENLLTWTTRRQQAMSANLANLDTPGYRAKDYTFDSELQEARAYDLETPVKSDGNNVDLEREMTEITKNGLQYVTLVQFLNHKLKTLRSSIVDGGRV
jgi:flagellar basal-body rod protein FlgB